MSALLPTGAAREDDEDFRSTISVLPLAPDGTGWGRLQQEFRNERPLPFKRCREILQPHARTAVIEREYYDQDYRSEYSAFYSRTYSAPARTASRIHFFDRPIQRQELHGPIDSANYLGYMVVRPSELGRVGRTMLRPPLNKAADVRTMVQDTANFFGQALTVEGVPFLQQDSQLGRCSHAAAWMCHYSAHLRKEVGRAPVAHFSIAANHSLGMTRPLPSEGLTVQQLVEIFHRLGLPPANHDVSDLPHFKPDKTDERVSWVEEDTPPWYPGARNQHPGHWDRNLVRIACQYLSSGFPIIVTTDVHAFVLCGWSREKRLARARFAPNRRRFSDHISFIRHDDSIGPYLNVTNVFDDVDEDTKTKYSPWSSLLVPLPEKLWLSPWAAEGVGTFALDQFAQKIVQLAPRESAGAAQFLQDAKAGHIARRTYAIPATRLKGALPGRFDDDLVTDYRCARMSRWVWVVELVDRRLRAVGEPCVVGEALLDATSSDQNPVPLTLHVPGHAWIKDTVIGPRTVRCSTEAYETGGRGSC